MAGIVEWHDPRSSTSRELHTGTPTAEIASRLAHYTTVNTSPPTHVVDSLPPMRVTGWPSAMPNAAPGAAMMGGIAGTGAVHTSMGMGSLGMVTVLIMLYNLCAGLGLGVMLWKGVIDWKGNMIDRTITSSTDNDTSTGNTTNTIQPAIITVTDNAGTDWIVPLSWVQNAVQRLARSNANNPDVATARAGIADAGVELTGYDGATGSLRLGEMVDAAVYAMRLRAAGLM